MGEDVIDSLQLNELLNAGEYKIGVRYQWIYICFANNEKGTYISVH